MVSPKRKICVVTGTRAEYGLLRRLIDAIQSSDVLSLQLIVTGSHLSPEFGFTIQEIIDHGYPIARKIEMLLSSDTTVGIAKSTGLGVLSFADALSDLEPDLMVLLGDRYEIFAAATAAMLTRIPIAHLHGGEVTEGAVDELIRHSITKMSHLHFVATSEYRRRVLQLGENPKNVFCVGGLGVDNLLRLDFLSRVELEMQLDYTFLNRNILVTFHPVTLEDDSSTLDHLEQLLAALDSLVDTGIIFTLPNADACGRSFIAKIKDFCSENDSASCFASLGQLRYFSCIRHVDCVVGNSSSGLLEVPSFHKATINIGCRQEGRLRSASVIDCPPICESILGAINRSFSREFQELLKSSTNPYGKGGAVDSILDVLENFSLSDILQKKFFDIP